MIHHALPTPYVIALGIVLGLPAGIAALLTLAPTVGPWIVSIGAVAAGYLGDQSRRHGRRRLQQLHLVWCQR
jgi:hypothetical protein